MTDPVGQLFSNVFFPGGKGKSIVWGIFKKDVDPSSIPSEEERADLRANAARQLINIGQAERDRRMLAGKVLSVGTIFTAAALLRSDVSPLARFSIAPALFLSYSALVSAKEGL